MNEQRTTAHEFLDGKVTEKTDRQFNAELVKKGAKLFEQGVSDAESLVARAKEATAAMDHLANHFQVNWLQCQESLKESLISMRSKKAAIEVESKQLLSAFSDVRKFFLDDRHDSEVKRMSEFVEVCERMKALKDCGFLDVVADTMLKLSEPKAKQ